MGIYPNGPHLCVSDSSLQVLLVLTFVLQEMVVAPLGAVAIGLPLLVDVQQRQMVALRHKELLPCRVTLLSSVWGPEENIRHTQHGHNGQNLHRNMPAVDTAVALVILPFIGMTVALTTQGSYKCAVCKEMHEQLCTAVAHSTTAAVQVKKY